MSGGPGVGSDRGPGPVAMGHVEGQWASGDRGARESNVATTGDVLRPRARASDGRVAVARAAGMAPEMIAGAAPRGRPTLAHAPGDDADRGSRVNIQAQAMNTNWNGRRSHAVVGSAMDAGRSGWVRPPEMAW